MWLFSLKEHIQKSAWQKLDRMAVAEEKINSDSPKGLQGTQIQCIADKVRFGATSLRCLEQLQVASIVVEPPDVWLLTRAASGCRAVSSHHSVVTAVL